MLGHAHAAKHESGPALAAYERALQLDAELEDDDELRANLRTMAADKDRRSSRRRSTCGSADQGSPRPKLLIKAAVSDELRAPARGARR